MYLNMEQLYQHFMTMSSLINAENNFAYEYQCNRLGRKKSGTIDSKGINVLIMEPNSKGASNVLKERTSNEKQELDDSNDLFFPGVNIYFGRTKLMELFTMEEVTLLQNRMHSTNTSSKKHLNNQLQIERRLTDIEFVMSKLCSCFGFYIKHETVSENVGLSIFNLTGIKGISRLNVIFYSKANDTDEKVPCPYKDVVISVAKAIERIGSWIDGLPNNSSVNFRVIEIIQDKIGIHSQKVTFSFDLYHPNEITLLGRMRKAKKIIREVALEDDIQSLCEDIFFMAPRSFDEPMVMIMKNENWSPFR